MKLWEKILLLFKRPYFTCDFANNGDYGVILKCKRLFGKLYILDEKIYNNIAKQNRIV